MATESLRHTDDILCTCSMLADDTLQPFTWNAPDISSKYSQSDISQSSYQKQFRSPSYLEKTPGFLYKNLTETESRTNPYAFNQTSGTPHYTAVVNRDQLENIPDIGDYHLKNYNNKYLVWSPFEIGHNGNNKDGYPNHLYDPKKYETAVQNTGNEGYKTDYSSLENGEKNVHFANTNKINFSLADKYITIYGSSTPGSKYKTPIYQSNEILSENLTEPCKCCHNREIGMCESSPLQFAAKEWSQGLSDYTNLTIKEDPAWRNKKLYSPSNELVAAESRSPDMKTFQGLSSSFKSSTIPYASEPINFNTKEYRNNNGYSFSSKTVERILNNQSSSELHSSNQLQNKMGEIASEYSTQQQQRQILRNSTPRPATKPSRKIKLRRSRSMPLVRNSFSTSSIRNPSTSIRVQSSFDSEPGPGSYVKVQTRSGPSFSMSSRRTSAVSSDSPGPAAYNVGSNSTARGWSMSARHSSKSRASSPGPGAYDVGYSSTTPGWSMSARYIPKGRDSSPGPAAYYVGSSGPVSGWSMSARHKSVDKSSSPGPASYSVDHGSTGGHGWSMAARYPSKSRSDSPGPAAYDIGSSVTLPGWSVEPGYASKSTRNSTGPAAYDVYSSSKTLGWTMAARHTSNSRTRSPGPAAYDAGSSFTVPGRSMTARRTRDSRSRSPGPGAYNVDSSSIAPGWSMAARRTSESKSNSPGPGAYYVGSSPITPGWSMAARRTSENKGNSPGPGAYYVASSSLTPGWSMAGKYTSKSRSSSPGPGAYNYDDNDYGIAWSMGEKRKEKTTDNIPGPSSYSPEVKAVSYNDQSLTVPGKKVRRSHSVGPGNAGYEWSKIG